MADEKAKQQAPSMSREEQIGFHKGSLATLAKEREEMAKILNVVEQLMQMHIKALKELGIDLEAQAKEIAKQQDGKGSAGAQKPAPKGTKKKIDELI